MIHHAAPTVFGWKYNLIFSHMLNPKMEGSPMHRLLN